MKTCKVLLIIRTLFILLVLFFSVQSWAKAEGVKDLAIEGISVGDSLLDYFTKKIIKKGIQKGYRYNDDSFYDIEIYNHKSFKDYQNLSFSVKKNDKLYKIYQIVGFNFYTNNVKECFDKVDRVSDEISNVLKDVKKASVKKPHDADPTGNSISKQVVYWHKSGTIFVECYDWSEKITKEKKWGDNFSVGIALTEYDTWLNTKAYN